MKIHFFQEILAKQMTRKEFLLHMGLILFILSGLQGMFQTLNSPELLGAKKVNRGFGAGPYGG